jgi:hypothetical protein
MLVYRTRTIDGQSFRRLSPGRETVDRTSTDSSDACQIDPLSASIFNTDIDKRK